MSPTMPPNYYQILGLEPTASVEEIRRRYRQLARERHPDVNPAAPASHQQFLQIAEAYQVLSDPLRRAEYDQALGVGRLAFGVWAWTVSTGPWEPAPDKVADVAADASTHDEPPTPKAQPPSPNAQGLRPNAQRPTPGARVDVDLGGVVLECRVRECEGRRLYLAAPPGARRSVPFRAGVPVTLTLHHSGAYLETETRVLEWVWMQPPVVVVGPLQSWREKPRRAARRQARELEARLVIDAPDAEARGATAFCARTRDISALGVSLTVAAPAEIREGRSGWLSLRIAEDDWSVEVPVRVARVRQWLGSRGRFVEVGVQVEPDAEAGTAPWRECLSRLGLEQ